MTNTLIIISICLNVICLVLLFFLLTRKKSDGGGSGIDDGVRETLRRLEEKTDTIGGLADYNSRAMENLSRSTEARLQNIQNRLTDDMK